MISALFPSFMGLGVIAVMIGGLVTLSQCRSDIAGAAAARVEIDRIEEVARLNKQKTERLVKSHKKLREAEATAREEIDLLRKQRDEAISQIPDIDEIKECPADCYLLLQSD